VEIPSKHLPKTPQAAKVKRFMRTRISELFSQHQLNWVLEKGRCETTWNCYLAILSADL